MSYICTVEHRVVLGVAINKERYKSLAMVSQMAKSVSAGI